MEFLARGNVCYRRPLHDATLERMLSLFCNRGLNAQKGNGKDRSVAQ